MRLTDVAEEKATEQIRTTPFASAIFLIIALISIPLLIVLTPPFQTPDEQQHFFRAYAISEGRVLPERSGDLSGAILPTSLAESAEHFLGNRNLHPAPGDRQTHISNTISQLSVPLRPEHRSFVQISAFYLPTAYIPQASGIAIGRLMHASPVGLLLAARLLNAVAAIAVVYGALRIAPSAIAPVLLWIALLPTSQMAFSSASADAPVLAVVILFSALLVRELSDSTSSRFTALAAFGCGAVFGAKFAYLPLAVSGAARWSPRSILHLVSGAGLGLIVVMWLHSAPARFVALTPGVDSQLQVAGMISDPLTFPRAFGGAIQAYWPQLWIGFVGWVGWLAHPLPVWAYVALTIAGLLSVVAFGGRLRIPLTAVLGVLLLAAISAGLTALALYVTWTPVGAPTVQGLQGRYFLPLAAVVLPLLAVALSRLELGRARTLAYTLEVIALVYGSYALISTTVRGFGVF